MLCKQKEGAKKEPPKEKITSLEYLNDRLQDQIDWLDKKSATNQSCYKRLHMTQIGVAALIPFLTTIGDRIAFYYFPGHEFVIKTTVLVGFLGGLVSVITAWQSLYKYQENWVKYRATAERLKREKVSFQTGAAPYNTESAFELLVQRVEAILAEENEQWVKTTQEKSKPVQSNDATTAPSQQNQDAAAAPSTEKKPA